MLLSHPGFDAWGSENRVKLRDMLIDRQVRICLRMMHVFHMHSPSQAI